MKARIKRSIAILLTAVMVLAMAFQSFAAPRSYTKPAAESGTEKITGTWSRDAAGNWSFNSQDGAARDGWYYLNTTNKATDYNWFCFDANGVMRTGWVQDKNDPSVWYYTGESKDSSEGGLMRGWITDPQDGKRYYLDPSTGIMCHGWKQIGGLWYYFGERQYANATHPFGAMYANEKTPDGYYVGPSGIWGQTTNSTSSNRKPDPKPITKTITDILPTGFPTEVENGWKNEKGVSLYKENSYSQLIFNYYEIADYVSLNASLTSKGNNYTAQTISGATVTFIVNGGEVTSIEFSNPKDTDYSDFVGTYTAAAAPTFKAVYDTTGGANTLTFYYDTVDHSGEGITVFEDGTTNYLFDNSKSKGAKWGYNGIRKSVKSVVIDSTAANYTGLTSTAYMFDDMEYAENISGAEYLDVSQVTNMSNMFYEYGYQSSTLNIVPDVSEWNTGKVTNMSNMFYRYGYKSTALNAVPDVSEWNTVNVTTVTYMFYCYGNNSTALSTVPNVSRWNTGNLTNMASMFSNYGCVSIMLNFTLDLSDWSVASVDTYGKMFESAATKTGKWSVTIPAKTGERANDATHWYIGDGTDSEKYISAPSGRKLTPAAVTFDENPFEPGNIKARQTLTIKGKNLDHVTKVIFCDGVEVTTFKSQSSEQIVIENFPAKARTGKVTLVSGTTSQEVTSDIDLVVAQPSVSEIYHFTGVKPNQKLTIEGENFDLVRDAIIGDDTCLDFIVSNEGHTIEIEMPKEVYDGTVKVIAYSGVEVTVATVTAAAPKKLTVSRPQSIGSIIGDSVPELASPSDAIHEAWESNDSVWCYIFGDEEKSLVFDDLNSTISISLKKTAAKVQDEDLLENEEIYKRESADYIIYFYLIDGNLDSIEFESKKDAYSAYEGIYRVPKTNSEKNEIDGTKEDIESDNDMDIPDKGSEKENDTPESEVPEIAAEVKQEEIVEKNKEVIPEEQSQQLVPEEEVQKEETDQEAE